MPESNYIINVQQQEETARLARQEHLLRDYVFSGLLPEHNNELPDGVSDVLDVACGPATWALDLAYENKYRGVQISAFDLSQASIAYANDMAQARGLENIHFRVMDATERWDYPDASFDLVNAQLLAAFLLPQQWGPLLREANRVLRPGGIIRITETDTGTSNSVHLQKFSLLVTQGYLKIGQSLSVDGINFNTLTMLPGMLKEHTSLLEVKNRPFLLDFSFGFPGYQNMVENIQAASALLEPFFLRTGKIEAPYPFFHVGISSSREYREFCAKVEEDVASPAFRGIQFYVTYWGNRT